MQSILSELKIKPGGVPITWVDNLSAIALASNPVLHARTKHIEIDLHFVRDKVIRKELDVRHVPSVDQIADIFTKPLSLQFFAKLRNKLGVCSLTSLELRGGVETTHDLMNEETSSTEKYGCNATRVDIDREDKESKAVPPQLMNWKAALLGH